MIIGSYWLIIIVVFPFLWSTTNIERLSVPTSHAITQAPHNLSIPITLSLQVDAGGTALASQLKESINERILEAPNRWKGLNVYMTFDGILGMFVRKECIHVNQSGQTIQDKSPEDNIYAIVQDTKEAVLQGRQLKYTLREESAGEFNFQPRSSYPSSFKQQYQGLRTWCPTSSHRFPRKTIELSLSHRVTAYPSHY